MYNISYTLHVLHCNLTHISFPSLAGYLDATTCVLLNCALCLALPTNDVFVEHLWNVHLEEEYSLFGLLQPLELLV